MYDPMKLPAPHGYGYMGEGGLQAPFQASHAYNMGEVPQFQAPMNPDQVSQKIGVDSGATPDVLKIVGGAGDKNVVGELLNIVAGQPSGLRGVSAGLAKDMLSRWGYPESADAWTYDQWAEAIGAAAQPKVPAVGY